jgi:hypothetical protein
MPRDRWRLNGAPSRPTDEHEPRHHRGPVNHVSLRRGVHTSLLAQPGDRPMEKWPRAGRTLSFVQRMRLTGARSNPRVLSRLEAAANAHSRISRSPGLGQAPSKPALRSPMGAIQGSVLEVLEASCEALGAGDIHARVERRLDRAVSRDTVASFLSVAARDATSSVIRSSPGRYMVRWGIGHRHNADSR